MDYIWIKSSPFAADVVIHLLNIQENNMLCPIKVNSKTIEPTVHTTYYFLDLLCIVKVYPIKYQ